MGLKLMDREIMTRAERSQTLNRLSLPGAPSFSLLNAAAGMAVIHMWLVPFLSDGGPSDDPRKLKGVGRGQRVGETPNSVSRRNFSRRIIDS